MDPTPYFVKYGRARRDNEHYVDAQKEAQAHERGIWSDPGLFRHYPDYAMRLVWWNERAARGEVVTLGTPAGDFVLPAAPRGRIVMVSAGSGITPVMAMLRTLDRRNTMPDVVVAYSSPTKERMIFRDEIVGLSEKHDSLTLHEQHTDSDGMLEMKDLDRVCPDWTERATWACGPGPMLDAAEEHGKDADLEDSLHLERFSLELGGDGGEGGTITFRNSNKTTEADGATSVMEAGEEAGIGMPYGCRMGICHTCTLTLVDGTVRDLRNGDETSGPNEPIQTCVTAAAGDCTLDI